jgi:L-arabinose isomerase
VTIAHLEDFASMVGIELVHIGAQTDISAFKNELRWNDVAYGSSR